MAFADLREFLAELEKRGKLHRISKPVEKEWEVAAVCRQVFRKIPAHQRPAVLFENIKGHDFPIAAGVLGSSREIYAMAIGTTPDKLREKWAEAMANAVEPVIVDNGPVQEVVQIGDEVDLLAFPIPTWTVEHDAGPYLTSPYLISKDPETGARNVGTYRMQAKSKNKTGIMMSIGQHMDIQLGKYKELGQKMPLAVVVGSDPTIGVVSVSKLSYVMDEIAVAGGLRGEPVQMVRCKTIPMEVPATAEIVLEGWVDPNEREDEGPFGEYTGYMGPVGSNFVFHITCITHRKDAIYQAFVSQMPPSESSCIRSVGREAPLMAFLKDKLGLPIVDLHLTEASGAASFLIISMKKEFEAQVYQVISAAWGVSPAYGKFTIIVDEDIDVRDHFAVEWAMSFRVRPETDVFIENKHVAVGLDPALAAWSDRNEDRSRKIAGKVAIDATKKHEFPPVAIPPKGHLDLVEANWEQYGFAK
ncbi:MAG: UbiD family decarboxylase [Thermincola sp.]|jgi:UbiD family decarboxylase|nr:UbiD family decarboxylase [Thermincola sp.]MDT3701435.1 UbiD family decarboxylase [Thermincola sp.]